MNIQVTTHAYSSLLQAKKLLGEAAEDIAFAAKKPIFSRNTAARTEAAETAVPKVQFAMSQAHDAARLLRTERLAPRTGYELALRTSGSYQRLALDELDAGIYTLKKKPGDRPSGLGYAHGYVEEAASAVQATLRELESTAVVERAQSVARRVNEEMAAEGLSNLARTANLAAQGERLVQNVLG